MIDAIRHNVLQHITEQLKIQEKEKKKKRPTKPQTKPLPFLRQEEKEKCQTFMKEIQVPRNLEVKKILVPFLVCYNQ